jgi:uncharacterized protein YggT (Ycf19 family)
VGVIADVLCVATLLAMLLLVAAVVTSWFAVQPGTAMETVARRLQGVTDVLLDPLRGLLPPLRLGRADVDLSPVVALVVLQVVRLLIGC